MSADTEEVAITVLPVGRHVVSLRELKLHHSRSLFGPTERATLVARLRVVDSDNITDDEHTWAWFRVTELSERGDRERENAKQFRDALGISPEAMTEINPWWSDPNYGRIVTCHVTATERAYTGVTGEHLTRTIKSATWARSARTTSELAELVERHALRLAECQRHELAGHWMQLALVALKWPNDRDAFRELACRVADGRGIMSLA